MVPKNISLAKLKIKEKLYLGNLTTSNLWTFTAPKKRKATQRLPSLWQH
jgi:hypothetical protein